MLIEWIVTPVCPDWKDIELDPIVWLDVGKVEAAFSMNRSHYVGAGGTGAGQVGRYNLVGTFIQSTQPVWMPHLSIEDGDRLVFTDGRHRFAWVRDHGAIALPVTTNFDGAAHLTALLGTHLRECTVVC